LLKKAIFLFVLPFFLLSSNVGNAEIKAGSVETGFSLGWLLIDEDIGSDDELFGRFDIGFNFTDNVGVELSLLNTLDSLEYIPDVSFYSLSMTLNMLSDSDINPYILLGVGAGNFNTDIIDNESEFTVNGGAGIKYFFSDKWAVRIDFRDYMTTGDTTHNFAGSIGLMASFDVFAPKAEAVPFFTEEPERDMEEMLGEGEVEEAPVDEPVPATTEEDGLEPEDVQEIIEEPEAFPVMEAGIVATLEGIPDDKIVILHKGAQLLIRFPYRSSDIDSESFNLLLQLISYSSKKDVNTVKIVGYSYDYDELQAAKEINSEREIKIRDFILKHSDIPASKIDIAKQKEGVYLKFKKLAEDNRKDINRLYIVVSFN
jgi:hypothetical protein